MRRLAACVWICCSLLVSASAQVDTSFVYNNSTPFGSLDIRLANSPSWYYYLDEGKTFSFRQVDGVVTNTYRDMTSWDSSPYEQGNLRERNGNADQFVMNYRFLKPVDYDPNYDAGYPLVVILHGLGEAGNCSERSCYHADRSYNPVTNTPAAPTAADFQLLNNDHQLSNGGNQHLRAVNVAGATKPNDASLPTRAFPGFVLFPQNLNGWEVGSVQDAIRIVRLMIKKYNVDPDRVYIEGISNGGHGAYEAIKRAPWLFSAAVLMSAIDDAFIHTQKVAGTVAHIPLRIFQGGQDANPSPRKTENYIKQFQDAGAVVDYTLYPTVGHGTWGSAFNEPDFFSWMLRQNQRAIHAFGGIPIVCGGNPVTLELAKGFLAYQWEKDGAIIAGANTSTYRAETPGNYRARFARVANPSEGEWNAWSEPIAVTVGEPPAKPSVIQYGTTLLRDLNNLNLARLESEKTWSNYYWYRDGQRVDFPGDQDDTVKYAEIPAAAGNGQYTLAVSGVSNCVSVPSDPISVFFNNQAPLNITTPQDFTATPQPSTVVELRWSDASGNEGGFEIWRRRRLSSTSFAPWELATITSANANSYVDRGMLPLEKYQYKIRAISTGGRSEYSTNTVEVETTVDQEPPTTPQNFMMTDRAIASVFLSWSPSQDNSRIKHYVVYFGEQSTITIDTTLTLTNLPLNQIVDVYVRAVDFSGNMSEPSRVRKANTYFGGLYYTHTTGIFEGISTIDWSVVEFSGRVPSFTLDQRTQEDYFNFSFEGFVFIDKAGQYQFRVSSDDGSRLYLRGSVIVNNDGIHTLRTVTSQSQTLSSGAHRVRLEYFDYVEEDSLHVEYKGPDTQNAWRPVTNEVLKSAETIIVNIEEPAAVEQWNIDVFPNPTTWDNIRVRLNDAEPGEVTVMLLESSGRNLWSAVQPVEASQAEFQIQLDQYLPPGVYFLVLRTERGTTTRRLMIHNHR